MAGISGKAAAFGLPANKLKYNGKEEQRQEFGDGSELEWLDYGARMYDVEVGKFISLDPMADYMRRHSPFSYAANNPIKYIDVDGMYFHDYQVSQEGEIKLINKTDDKNDRLFATNEDGSVNKEKSTTVEKGVLDRISKTHLEGNRPASTNLAPIADRRKATELFEFLASNTNVEWGLITINGRAGSGDKKTETRIVTNHLKNKVPRMNELINGYLEAAESSSLKILEISHSHPIAEANYPSGFRRDGSPTTFIDGDREIAAGVENRYRKNLVMFKVYVAPTGDYIYYNSNKIYKQY